MTENAPPPVSAHTPSMPQMLRQFLVMLLALTLVCLVTEAVCAWVLDLPYPYNWPLFNPDTPFADLTIHQARFLFFHTTSFFEQPGLPYMYPAPLSLFYKLYYLSVYPRITFVVSFCVLVIGASCLLVRALVRRHLSFHASVVFVTLVLACSYPFFFELQQGNLELIVWVFVAAGIAAFVQRHAYLAAACFGIAAAMKLFPIVFLGLLLSKRLYRPALFLIGAGVATTVIALWILCPDLASSWRGIQQGLADFQNLYVLQNSAVGADHSLFSVVKAAGIAFHRSGHMVGFDSDDLARYFRIYIPMAAMVGLCLYFLVIRKLPVINQVICLTVASILLPPVSYNYTLIHLYAPWALLVVCALERRSELASGTVSGMSAALVCFAVLFAPESEVILHAHALCGQIKAVMLVVLFAIALRRPFWSSFDEGYASDAPQGGAALRDVHA